MHKTLAALAHAEFMIKDSARHAAIGGQQVEPAIAGFLMRQGYVAETGVTDFGARKLALTAAGRAFRREGLAWWAKLDFLQELRITLLG